MLLLRLLIFMFLFLYPSSTYASSPFSNFMLFIVTLFYSFSYFLPLILFMFIRLSSCVYLALNNCFCWV
jgi:hypothetical protein